MAFRSTKIIISLSVSEVNRFRDGFVVRQIVLIGPVVRGRVMLRWLRVNRTLCNGYVPTNRETIPCKLSASRTRQGTQERAAEMSHWIDDLMKFPAESARHPADLRFRDGHRSALQEADEQCAIYLQAAVVADKTLLPESIHKFTYPGASGTNHLRQGRLAHLQGILRL
jgi:hypothetical protein